MIWIPSVLTIFSLREVKVVQSYTNKWIKHGTCPSLCIGDNHGIVLELKIHGDPVSLQLIFPGAIQTCEQYNIFSYINTTQQRFIGQTPANTTYTFIQNIPINTHT